MSARRPTKSGSSSKAREVVRSIDDTSQAVAVAEVEGRPPPVVPRPALVRLRKDPYRVLLDGGLIDARQPYVRFLAVAFVLDLDGAVRPVDDRAPLNEAAAFAELVELYREHTKLRRAAAAVVAIHDRSEGPAWPTIGALDEVLSRTEATWGAPRVTPRDRSTT